MLVVYRGVDLVIKPSLVTVTLTNEEGLNDFKDETIVKHRSCTSSTAGQWWARELRKAS